jgi:ribosomal protein S18 acetylase RimI-like enzyme
MPWFSRPINLNLADLREPTTADIPAAVRLFSTGRYRVLSTTHEDLTALVAGAPTMLLASGSVVWGVIVGGWPNGATIWLRGLALADGVPADAAFELLLPAFHRRLRNNQLSAVYYAAETASDAWLRPILHMQGYEYYTDVVVYEKRLMDIPAQGNLRVRLRTPQIVDLPAVLAIDEACFSPQWHKDDLSLSTAILGDTFFRIAELDGRPAGYAFATTHLNGRLIHLVRIAVLPEYRGQAIGVRLLAAVTEQARLNNATALTLNTQAYNSAAQRLYEWFGFRRTGETQTILFHRLNV